MLLCEVCSFGSVFTQIHGERILWFLDRGVRDMTILKHSAVNGDQRQVMWLLGCFRPSTSTSTNCDRRHEIGSYP